MIGDCMTSDGDGRTIVCRALPAVDFWVNVYIPKSGQVIYGSYFGFTREASEDLTKYNVSELAYRIKIIPKKAA